MNFENTLLTVLSSNLVVPTCSFHDSTSKVFWPPIPKASTCLNFQSRCFHGDPVPFIVHAAFGVDQLLNFEIGASLKVCMPLEHFLKVQ